MCIWRGVSLLTMLVVLIGCEQWREQQARSHLSVRPAVQTAEWAQAWWLPRHRQKLKDAQLAPVDVVMIGDSIMHNWELMELPLWKHNPNGYRELNLGFSGDRTEQVLWRIQHGAVDGLSPKAVVLMIGTNNTGARFDPAHNTVFAIGRIIQELRSRLPKSKILLLAIFPRAESPDDKLRIRNNEINTRLTQFVDNKTVYFLDLSDIFLLPDGRINRELVPDALHPKYSAYLLWRQQMAPIITAFMQGV